MEKKVALVIQGFIALNASEKSEVINEINKYQRADLNDRTSINESIRKSVNSSTINFGPAPSGCPCCGK